MANFTIGAWTRQWSTCLHPFLG